MREKAKLILAMLMIGTIGIFVSWIPLPSSVIACARASIGAAFLILVMIVKRTAVHWGAVKKNGTLLLCSGATLGFSWVFLFEAYRYTTVAVATLCCYMAPVFVMLLSPVVLGERLTPLKVSCTAAAVAGVVLISGVVGGGDEDLRGIGFGLAAAVLYGGIILLNKKLRGLEDLDATLCQLAISAVVMIPYVLCTQAFPALRCTPSTLLLLLVVGVVHTGITYLLFFSAIGKLPAQTASVLSYIDPVTAIILSAVLLRQPLGFRQVCGTALILGAMLLSEVLSSKTRAVV